MVDVNGKLVVTIKSCEGILFIHHTTRHFIYTIYIGICVLSMFFKHATFLNSDVTIDNDFYNSDRYFAVHSIFTYTLSLADIASPIYGLYTAFWCSICRVL